MIAHPPCTHFYASSALEWKDKVQEHLMHFLRSFSNLGERAYSPHRIENPISRISTAIRKPDQIIQPWQFGHGETKRLAFWLKNLLALAAHEHRRGSR